MLKEPMTEQRLMSRLEVRSRDWGIEREETKRSWAHQVGHSTEVGGRRPFFA